MSLTFDTASSKYPQVLTLSCLRTIVQPYYEKVARLFNGPDAVHPGIILMTRVDCANKVLILGFLIDNLQ